MALKPTPDISFPGKQAGEKVYLLIRKHPLYLIRQNLLYLLYFSIPIILYILGKTFFSFILSFPIYPIFILFVSLFYCFFLLFFLIEWIDFYFDAWLITDRRVIDVEQIGLFRRRVAETRLEKIQDISFSISGMFGTMFHYGTIELQTAAAGQRFVLEHIHEPAEIKSIVLKLYDARIQALSQINPGGPTGVTPGASQFTPMSNARSTEPQQPQTPQTNQQTTSQPQQQTTQSAPPSPSTPLSTPQAPAKDLNENSNK